METIEKIAREMESIAPTCENDWMSQLEEWAERLRALTAPAGDGVMARAWRNRFIDERMNAYPNDSYEMRRCYAESDANEFEDAFKACRLARGDSNE